jgi:hypothetical protein
MLPDISQCRLGYGPDYGMGRSGRRALTAELLRSGVGVEVERPEPQARTTDLEAGEHRSTLVGGTHDTTATAPTTRPHSQRQVQLGAAFVAPRL